MIRASPLSTVSSSVNATKTFLVDVFRTTILITYIVPGPVTFGSFVR